MRTRPRAELRARSEFARQGFAAYLPMALLRVSHARRAGWEPRPFFSGYLFLCLAPEERRWTQIRSTRGAIGAVHFGVHYPQVPEAVIAVLRGCENDAGLIELERRPAAPFRAGDRVRLLHESLAGLEGMFQQMRGRDRAMVLVEWLGGRVAAEVELRHIAAA